MAKDIKPTNPDTEVDEAKDDTTAEDHKAERKTNAIKGRGY